MDRLDLTNPVNSLLEVELSTFGIRRLPLIATCIISTSKTSIDCICTNLIEEKANFTIIQEGMSDHSGQICKIITETTNNYNQSVSFRRIFNKVNLNSLRNEPAKEIWEEVYEALSAEKAYN